MNKAVFLDRDGVINRLIFNPKTGEFESPHYPQDLEFFPEALTEIKKLYDKGFLLFLVSNQPSFAKGKTTLENIKNIHLELEKKIKDYAIIFKEFYYCYHHPDGIVTDYSGDCDCRKPKPFFINKAVSDYDVDKNYSWFIGDQDSDINCGKNGGLKTILINEEHSVKKRGKSFPDYKVNNLKEAVNIILGS